MRQDPYAILLQTKEALFPASHIPKSRSSSFKPPPAKKQKKTNQPMAKNNTPSTTLHMLEEQIEIAQKVMNSKVKEVEQVQVPMCPIIRNPEAIVMMKSLILKWKSHRCSKQHRYKSHRCSKQHKLYILKFRN